MDRIFAFLIVNWMWFFIGAGLLLPLSLIPAFYHTLREPDKRFGLFQIRLRTSFVWSFLFVWCVSFGLFAFGLKMLIER